MDGGRREAEAALDVGFGGRSQVDAGVGVAEGQILPLLAREARFLSARHLIHLWIYLRLESGGADERTLSCDLDPVRARRTWGASVRRQTGGAEVQASTDPAGCRCGRERRRDRLER